MLEKVSFPYLHFLQIIDPYPVSTKSCGSPFWVVFSLSDFAKSTTPLEIHLLRLLISIDFTTVVSKFMVIVVWGQKLST